MRIKIGSPAIVLMMFGAVVFAFDISKTLGF